MTPVEVAPETSEPTAPESTECLKCEAELTELRKQIRALEAFANIVVNQRNEAQNQVAQAHAQAHAQIQQAGLF